MYQLLIQFTDKLIIFHIENEKKDVKYNLWI